MPDNQPTYEDTMKELEEIVAKLEAGGLPLEETLVLYERGQALVAQGNALLDQAALRLQKLSPSADGGFRLTALDDSEE
jgi:exodeoxyribonuclease VII small subunit